MQIVIDIPEDELTEDEIEEAKRIADDCFSGIKTIIPDNATNGDVIKAIFMPNRITRTNDDTVRIDYDFTPEWWNAPYQKGGKE